jgi:hypothetical protein
MGASVPAKNNRNFAAKAAAIAFVFTLCLFVVGASRATSAAPPAPARSSANDDAAVPASADTALPAALCQVVYPLDESPEEGYRYMFLGNGFFVNDEGYVITAAHLL